VRDGIFLFLRAMQTLRMIIECAPTRLNPACRTEFLEIFEARACPSIKKSAMKILGPFLSVEDADTFFFMRAFSEFFFPKFAFVKLGLERVAAFGDREKRA